MGRWEDGVEDMGGFRYQIGMPKLSPGRLNHGHHRGPNHTSRREEERNLHNR
jgi:hypothetical protein